MAGKPKIFIDGKGGVVGAKIYGLLSQRDDLELLLIDPEKRRDVRERKKLLNMADLALLCLPSDTARETPVLVENPETRLLDTSPAHRTTEGWVYGFPELLPGQRQRIRFSKRVANPGCHASGFLSIAAPLVKLGVLPTDYPASCFSITGYSGGGKEMIAEFQMPDRDPALAAPSLYALGLDHNHLNEMQHIAGLDYPPVFTPILSDMYSGMSTSIPLQNHLLRGQPTAEDVCEMMASYYEGQSLVTVAPFGKNSPRLTSNAFAGTNRLEITVCGHEEQTLITARFDNLGKGVAAAAVQNLNLMLGFPETEGLDLSGPERP
ncbi:MAG: N-acetyl-gamma-glutamyl-phosphate reductase [Oscillospiraceae bacterium]|jgi:N-acetyl-gamma-glutamyl-phosphate reductase|nr:N-acetyl-gamma-glutamyl-phosphate reductase [Oscillospiraceae bacterium]